jgi:hypothetical protein
MKKLQILALTFGIATTSIMFAKLDQDGFSDITAKNPQNENEFKHAAKLRIKEEMGNPVTFESFQAFKEKVARFLDTLSSSSKKDDLQKAVRGVVDLFKAINMIENVRISGEVLSELEAMKSKLLGLNLPSRLKKMLEKRAV